MVYNYLNDFCVSKNKRSEYARIETRFCTYRPDLPACASREPLATEFHARHFGSQVASKSYGYHDECCSAAVYRMKTLSLTTTKPR